MKQVTKYEATDGKLFDNKHECLTHDRKLEIIQKLDEDLYYLNDVSAEEIVDWMIENGYVK